jgi:hypothetical protein
MTLKMESTLKSSHQSLGKLWHQTNTGIFVVPKVEKNNWNCKIIYIYIKVNKLKIIYVEIEFVENKTRMKSLDIRTDPESD